MEKSDWEERVKEIEQSIENSKKNKATAEKHIEEGEAILETFKEKIKCTSI